PHDLTPRIKPKLFRPLENEEIGQRIAESSRHRGTVDPIEHFDVDGSRAKEVREKEEGKGDPGPGRHDHVRSEPPQYNPSHPSIADEVGNVASGRVMAPNHAFTLQQRRRVSLVKRHPHPIVRLPPRLQPVELSKVSTRRANEKHPCPVT